MTIRIASPVLRIRNTGNFTTRAAGITTASSLAAATVAFLVNILMSRTLGPTGRGDVAWALQWTYLLAPVVAVGIDRRALRGEPNLLPTTIQIWVTGAVIAAIAIPFWSVPLLVVIAAAMVGAVISVERGSGMARTSLRSFAVMQLSVQGWTLLASGALYIAKVEDTLPWLLVYAAPAPILAVYRLARGRVFGIRRLRTIYTWRNGSYALGGLSALLAGRVERLILPVIAGARQLGLYMAIATATELVAWTARGIGESRVAVLRTSQSSRTSVAKRYLRELLAFSAVSLFVGIGIRYLLLPLLGPSYWQAHTLIVPLCISSVFWATYLQASSAWLARGKSHQSMLLDAGTATLTLLLACALIPSLGALGAALACILAYSSATVFAVAILPIGEQR